MTKKKIWFLVSLLILELVLVGVFFTKKDQLSAVEMDQTSQSTIQIESTDVEPIKEELPEHIDTKDWITSEETISFPILMYHSLTSSDDGNTLKVPPHEFKEHMEWLKENDYYTLSPEEAYIVLTQNKKPKDNIVWVTLDDGYLNNYTEGYPIFEELKLKGTINYITSKTDHDAYFHEKEMKEMSESPFISIESHTVSHLDLNTLSDEEIRNELVQSKDWLNQELNQETTVLCYPAGRYDERVEQIAEETGYKMAITTEPGYASINDGLFALKRVRVSPGYDKEQFGNYLTGT